MIRIEFILHIHGEGRVCAIIRMRFPCHDSMHDPWLCAEKICMSLINFCPCRIVWSMGFMYSHICMVSSYGMITSFNSQVVGYVNQHSAFPSWLMLQGHSVAWSGQLSIIMTDEAQAHHESFEHICRHLHILSSMSASWTPSPTLLHFRHTVMICIIVCRSSCTFWDEMSPCTHLKLSLS